MRENVKVEVFEIAENSFPQMNLIVHHNDVRERLAKIFLSDWSPQDGDTFGPVLRASISYPMSFKVEQIIREPFSEHFGGGSPAVANRGIRGMVYEFELDSDMVMDDYFYNFVYERVEEMTRIGKGGGLIGGGG